jgi:hypothetical protein
MNTSTMTLRRVEPVSAAKVIGALYGLLGLVLGAFVSLGIMLGGAARAAMNPQAMPALLGVFFGAGAIILIPVIYGGMGFVMTLIGCYLYNWMADKLGGIQWEVQVAANGGGTLTPATSGGSPPLS